MKKITVRAVSLIIALLLAITSVSAAAFEAPISTYRYSSVSSMSVFFKHFKQRLCDLYSRNVVV